MNPSTHIAKTRCYHCGENCNEADIVWENKRFCCEGCKTVFQILDKNNLCTYYSLNEGAGIQVKNGVERKRFEYLQDLDVQHKLVDFQKGNTVSITFSIPNIHCTSCVWLLENLQNIDEGIIRGTVNFLKRTVTIVFDDTKTTLRHVVEMLTTIGYEPTLKLEQLEEEGKASVQRGLWLKLGVAGFCFGNIMLFSFPEYLKMDQSGSSDMFRLFFGGLNILLALPVLLYSGIDYLKSAWAVLSQKGINLDVPISIGMLALFGRSAYEIISGTGAGYFDSFTGFIFFLLIGKVVQKKTFDQLTFDRDYKSYLPISVIRLGQKGEKSIPVNKLEIGDHVLIRNQELVPADSVNQTENLQIDYSFITGESEPVSLRVGELVFAGGKVVGKTAELIISKKVEHSYLTQLWENESFKNSHKDKVITSFADRISPHFTFTVLGIAVLSLLVWLQIDASQAFTIFTAVLIVACPCALALSTPFTLGSVVNILAANGFYLRNTHVIESLSRTSAFVFDKTGTITEAENRSIDFVGIPLSNKEEHLVASTCKSSTHPLSKAIVEKLKRTALNNPVSYFELAGKGVHAVYPDSRVYIGSSEFLEEQNIQVTTDDSSLGYGSKVFVAIDGKYRGYFRIRHIVRKGLSNLLSDIFKPVFLLSGDNEKEKNMLLKVFPHWRKMLFDQSPSDKLDFVNTLKRKGAHVTMIGDGLNDAGALQASNFGIAVSDDKSSFSPACDGIIDATSLHSLNKFVAFSKSAFTIILFSFGFSLLYNLTGLGFAITGHLSPLVAAILMPLSSVSIMAFTTVATRIQAQKMGLKIWV
ncbi:MAG: heavy metal translocating P-type ATPase metal-binding domain-containing protein [Balneolales bacterium]|nr:heavy metal translocating P-type ATPase metal-binding domain-containing protein [Balneolales bacterium]